MPPHLPNIRGGTSGDLNAQDPVSIAAATKKTPHRLLFIVVFFIFRNAPVVRCPCRKERKTAPSPHLDWTGRYSPWVVRCTVPRHFLVRVAHPVFTWNLQALPSSQGTLADVPRSRLTRQDLASLATSRQPRCCLPMVEGRRLLPLTFSGLRGQSARSRFQVIMSVLLV